MIAISSSVFLIGLLILSVIPINVSYATGVITQTDDRGRDFEEEPINISYEITHNEDMHGRHTILDFTFLDENTREFAEYVTFELRFKDAPSGDNVSNHIAFHTENGAIKIDILHSDTDEIVTGTLHDYLKAYMVNPGEDAIQMTLPLEPDSSYLIHAEIIGIDCPRCLFASEQAPDLDLYFNTNNDKVDQVVVVPEFPYHVILSISIVIGAIIAINRTGMISRYYRASR